MDIKIKLLLYGVSSFLVFGLLTWILKLIYGKLPIEGAFLGVFTNNDLLLALLVTVLLTVSYHQKRKIKNR